MTRYAALVNYLVARGNTPAARNAWNDIRRVLSDSSAETYEELHFPVARLLLHRGQLDFAEKILDDVNLQEHPVLTALKRHLRALREAQRFPTVFPLRIPPDLWWDGPHLFSASGDLSHWMPGRIDAIEDDFVYICAASPPTEVDPNPQYGFLQLSVQDFNWYSKSAPAEHPNVGQFLEIAWYKERPDPIIFLHDNTEWQDPNLPLPLTDPIEYLRIIG